MPILELRRSSPLSAAEIARLPDRCRAVPEPADDHVVARAEVDLPTAELARFAFALGQAVPDAELAVTEPPAQVDTPAEDTGEADDDIDRNDPWALLDAGRIDEAEAAFDGFSLDMEGRDRVRRLYMSTDPKEIALGCRIAGLTGWKSMATNMRRSLNHADTRVRRDAAWAIGKLAGPALIPPLQRLLDDPSPEVREAASEAIAAIEERSRKP